MILLSHIMEPIHYYEKGTGYKAPAFSLLLALIALIALLALLLLLIPYVLHVQRDLT